MNNNEGNAVITLHGQYAVLAMAIVEDSRLSWKAKGIMAYLASRPQGWKINETDLINRSTDGRDAVRAGLNELTEAGYLVRERQVNTEGRFDKTIWHIHNRESETTDGKSGGGEASDGKTTDGKSVHLVNTIEVNSIKTNTKKHICDDAFEETWKRYPKRSGGNSKADAHKAWSARIKQGHTAEVLREGVERYRQYALAADLYATQFVKTAATFFGPGLHFLEDWTPPPVKKTKTKKVDDAWDRVVNHIEPDGAIINGNSFRVD